MTPPLAHAGHWIAQLLYLLPVVAMIGAILWGKFRGRQHAAEDHNGVRDRSD